MGKSSIRVLLLTSTLLAGTAGAVRAEFFFGFGLGSGTTANSNLHAVQPSTGTNATFINVHWGRGAGEGTPYYDIRGGAYFKHYPNLGFEINYNHNKVILGSDREAVISGTWQGMPVSGLQPINTRIQGIRISNGENIVAINVLYRTTGRTTPSFRYGRLQFYAGAGPAFYWLHNSNVVDYQPSNGHLIPSGFGWDVLAGFRYGLFRDVSLIVEGKYTECSATLAFDGDGRLEMPLNTTHVQAGILYTF